VTSFDSAEPARDRSKREHLCPACHRKGDWLFDTRDRNRGLSDAIFSYFRCGGCGLLFLDPVPSDLALYYPASYFAIPESVEQLRLDARGQKHKIDIIGRFSTGKRLLEIGSAWGTFAFLAREAGYSVTAIEMDRRCCDFLERMGVVAVRSGEPEKAIQELDLFDVVCLWQNLEHVRNPKELFIAAGEALSENGVLIIATPNPESLQFAVFRRNWTHVDAPRHLTLIPPSLLCSWAEEAGLKTCSITSGDAESMGWNLFGWRQTFANFSQMSFLRSLLSVGGIIPWLALYPFESRSLRGSSYTAIFGRPQ
jgi:protein-L-isoaspartate O-methyltransferase